MKKWIIFLAVSLAYVLVYFHRFCAGVVAQDMMIDLSAGGTLIGLLGALYFYPYALMQLPAGVLSDTIGSRKTITIFLFFAVAGSLVMGLSANIGMALIGRILVGIGVSMVFVPTMKILTRWFTEKEFSILTGVFIALGSVGTLFATSPLAWLSTIVGWRGVFLIIGGLTLVITLLIWIIVRDAPIKEKSETPEYKKTSKEIHQIGRSIKIIIRNPYFWTISICFFALFGSYFTLSGLWGVPYLMDVYGLTKNKAGTIVSFFAIGMMIGNPLFGFLSEKVFKSRKKVIILISLFNLINIFILWSRIDRLSVYIITLVFFSFGLFANSVASIGFTANKELFPVKIAGTSTGLLNLFPYLGAAIFQQVLGIILENSGKINGSFTVTGYKTGFFVLLVLSLLGFFITFFVKETYGKQKV